MVVTSSALPSVLRVQRAGDGLFGDVYNAAPDAFAETFDESVHHVGGAVAFGLSVGVHTEIEVLRHLRAWSGALLGERAGRHSQRWNLRGRLQQLLARHVAYNRVIHVCASCLLVDPEGNGDGHETCEGVPDVKRRVGGSVAKLILGVLNELLDLRFGEVGDIENLSAHVEQPVRLGDDFAYATAHL